MTECGSRVALRKLRLWERWGRITDPPVAKILNSRPGRRAHKPMMRKRTLQHIFWLNQVSDGFRDRLIRGNQGHSRKVSPVAPGIACEDAAVQHGGVCSDEEIGQHIMFPAA